MSSIRIELSKKQVEEVTRYLSGRPAPLPEGSTITAVLTSLFQDSNLPVTEQLCIIGLLNPRVQIALREHLDLGIKEYQPHCEFLHKRAPLPAIKVKLLAKRFKLLLAFFCKILLEDKPKISLDRIKKEVSKTGLEDEIPGVSEIVFNYLNCTKEPEEIRNRIEAGIYLFNHLRNEMDAKARQKIDAVWIDNLYENVSKVSHWAQEQYFYMCDWDKEVGLLLDLANKACGY